MVENNILGNKNVIKYGIETYPACGTPIEALNYHCLDSYSLAKRIIANEEIII